MKRRDGEAGGRKMTGDADEEAMAVATARIGGVFQSVFATLTSFDKCYFLYWKLISARKWF
jgi:hypothetical protein